MKIIEIQSTRMQLLLEEFTMNVKRLYGKCDKMVIGLPDDILEKFNTGLLKEDTEKVTASTESTTYQQCCYQLSSSLIKLKKLSEIDS